MTMFAEMKATLEERVKSFGEEMDAADNARQQELDVQFAEARARAAKSRAALAAQGGPPADALEEHLAGIKRQIADADAQGTSRAESAAADAVAAEHIARYVFDLALNYLDEATAAAIEATYARDRAYVIAHEQGGGAIGEPPQASGGKLGALMDQVVGSAKRDLGKATGSTKMEIEGAAQEDRGLADWAAGKP